MGQAVLIDIGAYITSTRDTTEVQEVMRVFAQKGLQPPLVHAFDTQSIATVRQIMGLKFPGALNHTFFVHEMGIGASDEVREVDHWTIGKAVPVAKRGRRRGPVTTQMRSLESFCEEHGVAHVDFIKVDTEGHEWAVLEGLRRIMQKSRPLVIFEYGHGWESQWRAALREGKGAALPSGPNDIPAAITNPSHEGFQVWLKWNKKSSRRRQHIPRPYMNMSVAQLERYGARATLHQFCQSEMDALGYDCYFLAAWRDQRSRKTRELLVPISGVFWDDAHELCLRWFELGVWRGCWTDFVAVPRGGRVLAALMGAYPDNRRVFPDCPQFRVLPP